MCAKFWTVPLSSGARCVSQQTDNKIDCTSIDIIVSTLYLPRVDFIKMDIEGYELNGLRWAIKTI
jgi:FkbM family methyltransferase